MAKRHGDTTYGVKVKVKKRRGVKVRTINVPDSDDEGPPKVDTEYARLLKTRVAASGKADSITMNTLPVFELKATTHNDDSLDPGLDGQPEESIVENTPPSMPAKKPRKKANDSVCYPSHLLVYFPTLTILQTKMRTFLGVRGALLVVYFVNKNSENCVKLLLQ